jgi:MoaA/NifB/PqqE/SkfB family radical SAM enzyme
MGLRLLKRTRFAFENFLLAHQERATGARQVKSRPFVLLLDPASVCQLQCPVCPTGLENAGKVGQGRAAYRSRGLLGRDLFEAILDELGDSLFIVHLYNWGEPLLNRDFTYFVRELVRRDIAVDTHTNLSLPLSDAFVDELIDSGISRIEASIDGFCQESYGRYRVKGRFELARDNLVRLAAARDRLGRDTEIVWNFLVFRFNEHEIAAARAFCAAHGIHFVRREAAVTEALRDDFLPSYRAGENLDDFYVQQERPFAAEAIRSRPEQSCGWHYFYSVINADGSVSPCCTPWESDWDLGFVKPGVTRFADIWNGAALEAGRGDVAGHRLLARLQQNGTLASLRSAGDFIRQGTLCEGCPFPTPIHDLYSDRADLIVAHYAATARGQDPVLDRGFDLVRSDPRAFVEYFNSPLRK